MTLTKGTPLGPYEVIAPLGAGGMGEVYRARDPRLGREVTIKVLPEALVDDPSRLRRFEREAKATGALNHPHILAIHDIGEHEGRPYVVYELLEGQTLGERMREGPLPPQEALTWAIQAAQGLAAAHTKGIVHRPHEPQRGDRAPPAVLEDLDLLGTQVVDEPAAPVSHHHVEQDRLGTGGKTGCPPPGPRGARRGEEVRRGRGLASANT
jgi:hypothetical protein